MMTNWQCAGHLLQRGGQNGYVVPSCCLGFIQVRMQGAVTSHCSKSFKCKEYIYIFIYIFWSRSVIQECQPPLANRCSFIVEILLPKLVQNFQQIFLISHGARVGVAMKKSIIQWRKQL